MGLCNGCVNALGAVSAVGVVNEMDAHILFLACRSCPSAGAREEEDAGATGKMTRAFMLFTTPTALPALNGSKGATEQH